MMKKQDEGHKFGTDMFFSHGKTRRKKKSVGTILHTRLEFLCVSNVFKDKYILMMERNSNNENKRRRLVSTSVSTLSRRPNVPELIFSVCKN